MEHLSESRRSALVAGRRNGTVTDTVQTTGPLRPGAANTIQSEGEFVSQISASVVDTVNGTPMLQVNVPHPQQGFMAINFPIDDLFYDEEDPDFLEPVAVTASTQEYVDGVDWVKCPPQTEQTCSICLEKMEPSQNLNHIIVQTKCCANLFHDKCLREHFCRIGPPKCPLCRFDVREISRITESKNCDVLNSDEQLGK